MGLAGALFMLGAAVHVVAWGLTTEHVMHRKVTTAAHVTFGGGLYVFTIMLTPLSGWQGWAAVVGPGALVAILWSLTRRRDASQPAAVDGQVTFRFSRARA